MSEVSTGDTTLEPSRPPEPMLKRHLTAAVIGNALEFYDFTTYALFASQIGEAFFPFTTPFGKLMGALAAFGIGFVTRPIGGIVIGHIADRVGRRPAMFLSFSLMGLAIVGLALIPSYASIGIAAPALVILARTVQGFALGGEVGPTTAYLLEAAPLGARGLYTSWQSASQSIAFLVGGLVGLAVTQLLGPHNADIWGWRIAFLIGGLTVPVGLLIRRSLPETLHHEDHMPTHAPVAPGTPYLEAHGLTLLLGTLILANGTISTYVNNYMTTYGRVTLHLGPMAAFGAPFVGGVTGFVAALYSGWLSDRFGRRPITLWPRIVLLLASLPAFYLMSHVPNAIVFLSVSAGLSFLVNMSVGQVWLIECMPKPVRGRSFGILYASAIAVFGGTTQSVITWLIHVTGSPLAPAWYLMLSLVAGIVAIWLLPETAPVQVFGRERVFPEASG